MLYPLTATQARQRIVAMVQPTIAPTLTTAEVDLLVELAKRPDIYGLEVDDPAWEPTWNLRAAASEGWLMKAAKAVSDFNVEAGAVKANRREVWQNCMDMAERFRRGQMASVPAFVE